ncbi:MAG TPA: hypothetical protein DCX54_01110, partial [Flavobacteriales bacterium]|nr:hypothetical protein [Flavobacteriales bacterium]
MLIPTKYHYNCIRKYMIKMNGLRPYINYLTAFALAFAVSSCVDEGPKEETADEAIETGEVIIEDQVHYAVPSPHETMEFLKATGSKFNSSVLCSTEIREKFVDLKGKSMGLGIFIADLAYTASFSEFQASLKYFNAIMLIADDIGIGSSFDQSLMSRIENNLDNSDSLQVISDASYYNIIGDLEAS